MKKFISRIVLLFPLLLFVVLLNFIVDPARLFQNKDYERGMANALISGSAVTNFSYTNFDDRFLEKFWIQSLSKKRDIAVFGSSQMMPISSEMFPGKTFFNNAMTSATLEDYISLYEIYREKKMLPSTIIIGVNAWDFNRNSNVVKWQRFGAYYSKFINSHSNQSVRQELRPQDIVPYQLQQLISLSYFQASLQFLFNSFFYLDKSRQFSLTNQRYNDKQTIMPDGSQSHPKDKREASPAAVKEAVESLNVRHEAVNILGYYQLDPVKKEQFISLIQSMKADGIRVIIFLPPYNPIAYDYYIHSDQFKIIKDVENFLKKTSETYGLTLIGSYDARQLSVPESSFFDEIHLRNDTELKRIFSNYKI